MRSFREQLKKDTEKVFFNLKSPEFITEHTLSGIRHRSSPVKLGVVVDKDLYTERALKDGVENITLDGLVFFIEKALWIQHFKTLPCVASTLLFDGKRYQVTDMNETFEMLEITLQAARG